MTLLSITARISLVGLCVTALLGSPVLAQSNALANAPKMAAASLFMSSSITLQDASNLIRDYKNRGLIGETKTGYLGLVRDEEYAADVVRLINEVRRDEYVRLATENNVPVTEIEALAGQRSIQRTQSGHYIEIDGEWVRKP